MHNAHAYENLTQDNSDGDLKNKIVCDKLFIREFIKSKTVFGSMEINFRINFLYLLVFGATEAHSSDPLYIYRVTLGVTLKRYTFFKSLDLSRFNVKKKL